jgi:hypothetical protein
MGSARADGGYTHRRQGHRGSFVLVRTGAVEAEIMVIADQLAACIAT